MAPIPLPAAISLIVARHNVGAAGVHDPGSVAEASVALAVPKVGALPAVKIHRFWNALAVVVMAVV
jgi:hypothetical protein